MSNSRLEKFIYAICSMEVSDLPAPLSRIEILWNCLITGETPDFEPQSRNEKYLMAMLGLYELENLPTPMSRGEKLLYKIAMGETDLSDIPAYLSRYEELLGYLAENGGVGDFEYILQTLNQRLSTLYSTKERPMKQAVIKGDTLVNELSRPSLKNTMMNAASQKLNHGYDNGKTLVNINAGFTSTWGGTIINNSTVSSSGRTVTNWIFNKTLFKENTKYMIIYTCDSNIVEHRNNDIAVYVDGGTSRYGNSLDGVNSFTFMTATLSDTVNIKLGLNTASACDMVISDIMIIEYQDGMENWDIPYFEGTKTFSATPNVVDGEFKQAVVKGQTLVNIKGEITNELKPIKYPNFNFLIPLAKKNTDYLIKYDTTLSNGVLAIGFLKDANTWSKNLENQPNTGIFKLNSGDYPNYFRIIGELEVTLTINNLIIIEYQEGMENWDIPYFEGMQSVQLSEVTTTGKNLFDGKNMSNGYISTSGGIDAGNIHNSLSDYIKVEPSTSYAYKCFVENQTSIYGEFAFFDEDKKFISVLYSHHTSNTCIITPDNCHYLRAWNNQYEINGNSHPNAMLVKTTNLPSTLIYEPYQSNTLTLAEPVTLRKVGDVEDEFDALTGQVTERVGQITFNGNEHWGIASEGDKVNGFSIWFSVNSINSIDFIICDKLPFYHYDDLSDKTQFISYRLDDYSNNVLFIINIKGLTSLEEVKQWLSQNPITVQYQLATPTTKTINTTITDQDGATQSKLHSFNDGYLSVSSQGLLPSAVNYEVPTNNSYYLPDMLTLGAQYTVRASADCNATIDGKLLALGKNRTFTTPSSVTDRLMVLDAPVDDLMFIKGDQTAKDFGYFEGMKSVVLSNKMPVLTTTGKNLFDASFIPYDGSEYNDFGKAYATSIQPILRLKPNTTYCISGEIVQVPNHHIAFKFVDSDGVEIQRTYVSLNNNGGSDYKKFIFNYKFTTKMDGNIYFNVFPAYSQKDLDKIKSVLLPSQIQIEEGSTATSYEPYKSNILTTPEDLALRGIGKVKDELNVATGELTQRISEVVLDGSEEWHIEGEGDTHIEFSLFGKINDATLGGGTICDKIPEKIGDSEGITIQSFGTYVKISKAIASDVESFKTYLQSNPLTVQYELAEPVIKTVDLTVIDQDGQSTKLKTFNDISYVEINADPIVPSVDVEVATKISETLSTMGPKQLDISETQDQLGQTIDEQAENTDATMMATTEIYEQTL